MALLNPKRIPQHVAIIMDGNGRWAKQQGKERPFGHEVGAQATHDIVEEAVRLGIKYLTLYTFSTENWNRPEAEIVALMNLLFEHIEEETFMKNDVRFCTIGDTMKLPQKVQERLRSCIEHTANNKKMTLVLALSYSSKWEITKAVQSISVQVRDGNIRPEDIDDEYISRNLTTSFMPDPDLLIRTGGEVRLSNFLLWQCAYSELYFCDTYWPDFNAEEFRKAIINYQMRERRFGKTGEQVNLTDNNIS